MSRKNYSILRTVSLIAIVAFSVFGLVSGVQAQEPDAIVGTSLLRVRTGPSRSAAIVATEPKGTAISLDGRDRFANWVHGKAADGAVGWMSRPYLSIRNSLDVNTLPVLAGASSSSANVPAAGRLSGGFELGGQVVDLNGNTVAAMQRSGMHWVKRQIGVGDGQSAGWIAQAHGAGFKILLSVIGDKNSVLNPGYFNQYAGYVGTLAGQGADALEVWNEANIDREWPTGHIDPGVYTQLLAAAYKAIKANNGNTIVISGAPSPTGAEGAFGLGSVWNDDHFYNGLAAAGAGSYADCIGVHYNEGIVSPVQTSGDPRDNYPTRYFSTMLNRALAGFPGKKACFTELGYLTAEGYPPLPGGFAWAGNVTFLAGAGGVACLCFGTRTADDCLEYRCDPLRLRPAGRLCNHPARG